MEIYYNSSNGSPSVIALDDGRVIDMSIKIKPLKVFKNGALWFDNVKNMVCVIDGVKGSCVNGFEYRVLYFDTLSENYLTTNDLDETSITTEYANKNLTIPTFLKFLKIGEMWVDGDGDVFKIEYLHKTNDGGITHVGVDNKKSNNIVLIHEFVNTFKPYEKPVFKVDDVYYNTKTSQYLKIMDIAKNHVIFGGYGFVDTISVSHEAIREYLTKVNFSDEFEIGDSWVNDGGEYITIKEHDKDRDILTVAIENGTNVPYETKHTCCFVISRYKKTEKRRYLAEGELWVDGKKPLWVVDVYKNNHGEIIYVHYAMAKNKSEILVQTASTFFSRFKKLSLDNIILTSKVFCEHGKESVGCIIKGYDITNGQVSRLEVNKFNWFKSMEVSDVITVLTLDDFFRIYEL